MADHERDADDGRVFYLEGHLRDVMAEEPFEMNRFVTVASSEAEAIERFETFAASRELLIVGSPSVVKVGSGRRRDD